MHILIVANHFPVCSARYAADAFTRLGHEVYHIGQETGRNIWGMQVPAEYVWSQEMPPPEWKADLVVVMDSDPTVLNEAEYFSTYASPIVVWGVDSHVRDYRRPYFDAYFLAHKAVSIQPYDEKTFWLPCGYDPVAFPPSPIAWNERQYDVCCIGVLYPQRWALVNAMRAAGLKVLAGTGLIYDTYRDAYHNSRVALVSTFNGDLPIRLFEGAGMGCAVIHDHMDDLSQITPPPFMPVYDRVETAVSLAQNLTANGAVMGEEAVTWAADHTWEKRAQVILNWLEARS